MPAKTANKGSPWPPTMVVCVGAVVLSERRVLFVRQAKGGSLAGMWSIPWGLVEEGEAPESAALRETSEESGITAALDGLLGIQNLPSPGWLGIVFACRPVAGQPTPDGVETDAVAWFSLSDILNSSEPFEPWCKWIALRVLNDRCALISGQPQTPYSPHIGFL